MPEFKRLAGDSFSRANALRPLHHSLRRFFAVSIVCFASLAAMSLLHSVDAHFRSGVSVDVFGAAVVGTGCLLVVALAAIHLIGDCIRRWSLARMSPYAFRGRLISEQRAQRYEADPGQLKGMTIGAVFFGVLCAFAVIAKVVGLAS